MFDQLTFKLHHTIPNPWNDHCSESLEKCQIGPKAHLSPKKPVDCLLFLEVQQKMKSGDLSYHKSKHVFKDIKWPQFIMIILLRFDTDHGLGSKSYVCNVNQVCKLELLENAFF